MLPLLSLLACAPDAPVTPPAPAAPLGLSLEGQGPCRSLPAAAQSLVALEDGTLLVTAMSRGPAWSLWRVDPETWTAEDLGPAAEPAPVALPGGGALVARAVPAPEAGALATVRVGQRPETLTRVFRWTPSGEAPLTPEVHDVSHLLVVGEDLLYVAGRRLWRLPLAGGALETTAREVLGLHAALPDGRLLVDMAWQDRLTLALLGPEGEVVPLGDSADRAVVVGGMVLAQDHPAAPLFAGPLEGPLGPRAGVGEARLLPGGHVARPVEGGVKVEDLVELRGPVALRALVRRGDGHVALAVHDTVADGAETPLDEAELCVIPPGGRLEVPVRRLPRALEGAEARLGALQPGLERLVAGEGGRLLTATFAGPGPVRPDALRALAARAHEALGLPELALVLEFSASGRFVTEGTRDGHPFRRRGVLGVVVLTEPGALPLSVTRWSVSNGRCEGEVQNDSGQALSLEVECGPFSAGNWGYLSGTPPELKAAVRPAPLPPGGRGAFTVKAHAQPGEPELRLRAGGSPVPALDLARAEEAERLLRALLDLQEGRALRPVPRGAGLGTPTAASAPPAWVGPDFDLRAGADLIEDAEAMALLAEDVAISLRGREPPGLVSEDGRRWRLEAGRWVTP